jgi:hypothetical protein
MLYKRTFRTQTYVLDYVKDDHEITLSKEIISLFLPFVHEKCHEFTYSSVVHSLLPQSYSSIELIIVISPASKPIFALPNKNLETA